jgi:hypothetical protein
VRPDIGAADLAARIAVSTVEERVAWLAEMREAGIRSAWQQVDRAGITGPLEVAEFLLRRLYADESDAWFEGVLGQLRAAQAAGTWSGFASPDDRRMSTRS